MWSHRSICHENIAEYLSRSQVYSEGKSSCNSTLTLELVLKINMFHLD